MCRKMYDRHREGLLIMYQIDFNKPEHVHFIGIGGISMSGLAEILLDEGFSISGSDSHETALTERLEKKGARVYYGQRAVSYTHLDVYKRQGYHRGQLPLYEKRAFGGACGCVDFRTGRNVFDVD